MSIEYPSFRKKITGTERNEPNPALKFLKKSAGIMAAVGIMTLNPNQGFLGKNSSIENGPEFYIEHALKNNPLLRRETQKKIDFLVEAFSKDALDLMAAADLQAREARKNHNFHPSVNGFEKLGIDPKYLLKIFSEEEGCYPKGTINGNVANISYVNEVRYMQAQYGTDGRFLAAGVASYAKDDITFFQIPVRSFPKGKEPTNALRAQSVVRFFGYELGHMCQGTFSNFLSPEERIDFLCDVTSAFPNSGLVGRERFEDYVGQIKNKDQKKEYYHVISEYWAILCETYLNEPEKFFSITSPEEQALVKRWLLRDKGKDFDPVAARDKRHLLTERMVADQNVRTKQREAKKIKMAAPKKQSPAKKQSFSRKRLLK